MGMTPEEHVAGHMRHLQCNVLPKLKAAFMRGSQKYRGAQHWDSECHIERTAERDIEHVARCHVAVRLADAEDAASTGDLDGALSRVESAIGYALVLHRRLWDKREEQLAETVEDRARFSEGDG